MTTLTTARLTLRLFQHDDVAAYALLRADPDLIRFLPGRIARAADARAAAERTVSAFIEASPPCPWSG